MSTSSRYTPELSKETLDSITRAFQLFQDKNGIINCEYLINALKDLKYDQQEPVVYDVVQEVCSTNKTLSFDEFVALAFFKLGGLIENYNPEKATISTYVYASLKGYMLNVTNPNEILSFRRRNKILKLQIVREELGQYSEPTNEELSKAMGISLDELYNLLQDEEIYLPVSIDDENNGVDIITSQDRYTNQVEKNMLHEELFRILKSCLTPDEQYIIKLRFGFGPEGIVTREKIGKMFNVSGETVRNRELRALKKLRNSPFAEFLKDYYYDSSDYSGVYLCANVHRRIK